MKRPGVFENYRTAELLEKRLEEAGLPVVAAKEFRGKKMQRISGQYYYVFNWVEGKALRPGEITEGHCKTIGAFLARMHRIDRREERQEAEELHIDWKGYVELADKTCPEIGRLLAENREFLYEAQSRGNAAGKNVPAVTCVSNGDMDSKNVLWAGGQPYIIDLECLCYGNPYTELFQLALYWSGCEQCRVDFALLGAFIQGYQSVSGKITADWEALYDSNTGSLEWLEYNIKRALGVECGDPEEQKLGLEQTRLTLDAIRYYHSIRNELLRRCPQ
jgi:Ser/Thr protein kinase RdoA (MazF antagonist)